MIKCFVVVNHAIKHSTHKVWHHPIVRHVHKPLKYLAAKPIATATVVCVVVGGGAMPWLTPKPAPLATPGPSGQPSPAYPGGGSFPFGSGFAIASDIENLSGSSINPFPSTVSPVLFGPAFSPLEDITLPQLDILKPTDTTSLDITTPMIESTQVGTQVDEPPSWSILLLGLLLLIVMRNVRWRIFGLRL